MKHNTRSLLNESFTFSGKHFLSWLGPANLYKSTLGWYYCDDGELFLLKKSWDGQYILAEETSDRPLVLKNADEIKNYVRNTVQRAIQSEDMFETMLQTPDVMCFAIYPGFSKELDNLGDSEDMLQFFCDCVESNDNGIGARLLVRCIPFISRASKKANLFIHHCLNNLPARSIGLLFAHGLTGRLFWSARHREALIEGWRFQLRNPTQQYLKPSSSTSICLIERDISPDDKGALLIATGLTEADLKSATDIANLAPDEEPALRTTALLRFLAHRSNLGIPQEASINIEGLGSLTD